MLKNITASVVVTEPLAKDIFRLILHCPKADLRHFVPGQFAHVRIPGHNELLLGRPISINAIDVEQNTITLICRKSGKGTTALSKIAKGAKLSAILPVGRGFYLRGADKKVFLVGGGIGIAPLPAVVRRWPDKSYEAFLGYASSDVSYKIEEFSVCDFVHIASDDGSIGERGVITGLLERRLGVVKPDVILACGPTPMLRALKQITHKFNIKCQVSLEQRMCCGFGACSACVCGVNTPEGKDYKKVCVQGPVFDICEVAL